MNKKSMNQSLNEISYNYRLTTSLGNPVIHTFECTNNCNLRCPMCILPQMKRKTGYMDFSLFKKIIDEAQQYNDVMWLHHFGEPLLHPQLFEFIAYCQEKGIKAGLSTNAALLTEEKAKKLLATNIHKVVLSVDGMSPESHNFFRKGSSYESTMKNAENFINEKKKMKKDTHIIVSIIKMKGTDHEVSAFVEKWKKIGADEIWIKPFIWWDGSSEDVKKFTLEEEYEKKVKNPCNKYPCKTPWTRVSILWDGRVVPCCFDCHGKYILGDLKTKSLKEIWNGAPMKELRRMHLKNTFPEGSLCSQCVDKFEPTPSDPFYIFKKVRFKERVKKLFSDT